MSSPRKRKSLPLIDTIKKHIVEEGDCWNWIGALQASGSTPMMNYNGRVGGVRRFILLERGPNQPGMLGTYTCSNPMCVNPDHVAWAVRRTVQRRTTEELGYQQDVMRCKKLSDKARAKGKLTKELVEAIREADGPQHKIGKVFGISQATVSKIKRGAMWKTYGGNPFAGLGAR